ncbi:hypothetical protein M231_06185 [Tremella mesenterica]|uniref:Uncharacterized protein n=1 Tax=Tremella mesenterica TaxID=5217 RepID=A0A4Q1BE87_TREME|nr:hypothetical protein M231_06185 [Tremella mesenterica]
MEAKRVVGQKPYSYDLRDDATADEMARHVEDFLQTIAEAKMGFMMLAVKENGNRVNRENLTDSHPTKDCYKPKRPNGGHVRGRDDKKGGKKGQREQKKDRTGRTGLKEQSQSESAEPSKPNSLLATSLP